MPLGHALMILMEHFMQPTTLHYSAFAMGFVGLCITIIGCFQKGDTRGTIWGIIGAMLFWTGWVEFLFSYFASRFGTHCDLTGTGIIQTTSYYNNGILTSQDFLINNIPLDQYSISELKSQRGSRPEYLIMPATFGMWMMIMTFYLFSTRTGCSFMQWIQRHTHIEQNIELRPVAHHASLVVFMEWNIMMWGLYLLLMFCYDPVFLGPAHPVTLTVAIASLVGSILMLKKQLTINSWGRNIRFALATVIVFWTFVEIMGRNGILVEIWTDPMHHVSEMLTILGIPIVLTSILFWHSYCKTKHTNSQT